MDSRPSRDQLAEALLTVAPLRYADSWPDDDPAVVGPFAWQEAAAILAALDAERAVHDRPPDPLREAAHEAVQVPIRSQRDTEPLREAARALVDSAVLVPMEPDDDDGPAEVWCVSPDPLDDLRDVLRSFGLMDADVGENTLDDVADAILAALPSEPPSDPERLARLFHEAYERLAPRFGYATRKASAVPWSDVPATNKALMVAVAGEVLAALNLEPKRG